MTQATDIPGASPMALGRRICCIVCARTTVTLLSSRVFGAVPGCRRHVSALADATIRLPPNAATRAATAQICGALWFGTDSLRARRVFPRRGGDAARPDDLGAGRCHLLRPRLGAGRRRGLLGAAGSTPVLNRILDTIMAFSALRAGDGIVAALGNSVENINLRHRADQHPLLRAPRAGRGQHPPRGRFRAGRPAVGQQPPSRRWPSTSFPMRCRR